MASEADRIARRRFLCAGLGTVFTIWSVRRVSPRGRTGEAGIANRLSPMNAHRPMRPQTLYIVLHTTEGASAGSLGKIWRRGEANYFVGPGGGILRIIDRAKIATHAGRSMWEGRRNIDDYSIGIEVVGHHDQDITEPQYEALSDLLRQLKAIYKIPDQRVLTHSMVAYGRPNRFYRNDHRGRKRCGMIFARPEVRQKLGLEARPEHDADVQAGRLIVADAQLYQFLYAHGPARPVAATAAVAQPPPVPMPPESNVVSRDWTAWHIARENYDSPDTIYSFPDGKKLRGDQVREWNSLPEGTQVTVLEGEDEQSSMEGFLEIGKDGDSAQALAGDAYDRKTTIYFFKDGFIRTGLELKNRRGTRTLLDQLPAGTRVLVGYIYGGYVKSRRPPSNIAGIKWNYPSTFYRFPDGRIVSGDEIDDFAIPVRTLIFYQN